MAILSLRIDNTVLTTPKTFKAPRHMMYRITDVYADIIANASLTARLLSRSIEAENIPTGISDTFYSVALASAAKNSYSHYTIPVECKFISLIADSSANGIANLYINYELFKASKVDLLWEWFRKGR